MENILIQLFKDSYKNLIKEITGCEVNLGEPYKKESPFIVEDIAVLFGFYGDYKGQVIFSMDKELALLIANAMAEDEKLLELDEYAKSAIAEMGNIALGHITGFVSENNISIDITPPCILTGEKLCFSFDKMNAVCLPVHFSNGKVLEINYLLPI